MAQGPQAAGPQYNGPPMIDGMPYDEYMKLNSPLHPDFGKAMAKTTDTSLLTNALRNRKDVATLALLSGDPTVGNFGSTL